MRPDTEEGGLVQRPANALCVGATPQISVLVGDGRHCCNLGKADATARVSLRSVGSVWTMRKETVQMKVRISAIQFDDPIYASMMVRDRTCWIRLHVDTATHLLSAGHSFQSSLVENGASEWTISPTGTDLTYVGTGKDETEAFNRAMASLARAEALYAHVKSVLGIE